MLLLLFVVHLNDSHRELNGDRWCSTHSLRMDGWPSTRSPSVIYRDTQYCLFQAYEYEVFKSSNLHLTTCQRFEDHRACYPRWCRGGWRVSMKLCRWHAFIVVHEGSFSTPFLIPQKLVALLLYITTTFGWAGSPLAFIALFNVSVLQFSSVWIYSMYQRQTHYIYLQKSHKGLKWELELWSHRISTPIRLKSLKPSV